MIIKVNGNGSIFEEYSKIGLSESVLKNASILIKVNLARPATPGHPRTDPLILSSLIKYIKQCGGNCSIAESADGYLKNNIEQMGIGNIIVSNGVEIIDLDHEEVDKVVVEDEEHYLPKCLKHFDIRIGFPATSKRPQMVFSNNVKLFVGAVPRRMYQIGEPVSWRPLIHQNLHKSVANIYKAIQKYAPFGFFINGGLAMDEHNGEFLMKETLLGNDGLELDLYVLDNIFHHHEYPEYIKNLIDK